MNIANSSGARGNLFVHLPAFILFVAILSTVGQGQAPRRVEEDAAAKDATAKREAAEAIELLRSGRADVWPLLRAGGDNARRNYLLHLFSNGGIDASVVIKRLRTETDREYAVRAGSVTARFYGTAEELLEDYAWYSKNPPRSKNDPPDPADPQRTWPVGQLKPNDFGLFDVYGNVWEWTQSPLRTFEPGVAREDVEDDVLRITDTMALVRRGGSFRTKPR